MRSNLSLFFLFWFLLCSSSSLKLWGAPTTVVVIGKVAAGQLPALQLYLWFWRCWLYSLMCYLKPRHFKRCHLHVKYLTAHRAMCGEVEVKQKGTRRTPAYPVLAAIFEVHADARFCCKRPCLGASFASRWVWYTGSRNSTGPRLR